MQLGIEGEMLAVTKFRPRFELHVWGGVSFFSLITKPHNVFLVTTSILPSVPAVLELHALSPPEGQYALDLI